jgi:hypothetical protein
MERDPFGSDSAPRMEEPNGAPPVFSVSRSPAPSSADVLDPQWEDAARARDCDRPVVSCPMLITGPASRVAFDALTRLYTTRNRSALSNVTSKAARSILESVVAPFATAASSRRFTGDSSPPSIGSDRTPHQHSNNGRGTSANSANDDGLNELARTVESLGIRERTLQVRQIPKNRFARIVLENMTGEHGAAIENLLSTLSDECLARRDLRLLQATSASCRTASNWQAVDARRRYLHSITTRGTPHIVAASLDQLHVRLRAEKVRRASSSSPPPLSASHAFDTWFADIDVALSDAFAANPSRCGTVVLLTQSDTADTMSGDEMQRLIGRVHEAITSREQERLTSWDSMSPADTGNGASRGKIQGSPIVALIIISVEYGSRTLMGAAHGEVAVSEVGVLCSAVNTVTGPLELRSISPRPHAATGAELVKDTRDLVELFDALALCFSVHAANNFHCLVAEPVLALDDSLRRVRTQADCGLTLRDEELVHLMTTAGVDSANEAEVARVLELLRTWGTIITPQQSATASPLCHYPLALHGLVGAFLAGLQRAVENSAEKSVAWTGLRFHSHHVHNWTAWYLAAHVYLGRDDAGGDAITARDVKFAISILEAFGLIAPIDTMGESEEDFEMVVPAATSAPMPEGLPHAMAYLCAAALRSERSTAVARWVSLNVDPGVVLAELQAAFALAVCRGPIGHAFTWRDGLLIGVDADEDATCPPVLPQRTLICCPRDPQTGLPERILLVLTVAPSIRAEAAASEQPDVELKSPTSDSSASEALGSAAVAAEEMFAAVLAVLTQLQCTALPGLQFAEGVPCPTCLRRVVPAADAAWSEGRITLDKPHHDYSASTPLSASTVGTANHPPVHFFAKQFTDRLNESYATHQLHDDSPRGRTSGQLNVICPSCSESCNLRTLRGRASKLLHGALSRPGESLPPFVPLSASQKWEAAEAALEVDASAPSVLAASLCQFGSDVDSFVWSMCKWANSPDAKKSGARSPLPPRRPHKMTSEISTAQAIALKHRNAAVATSGTSFEADKAHHDTCVTWLHI